MTIPQLSNPPALLTERETARRLGVKPSTLRQWRYLGRPPSFIRVNNAIRYDPLVIEQFIDESRRKSTGDPGPHGERRRIPKGSISNK